MSTRIKFKPLQMLGLALLLAFTIAPATNAMHIFEGYLPPVMCIAWGVLCIPFLVIGCKKINKVLKEDQKNLLLLAMCGAFAFILSALKIPSVTGSCSHPTGVGLGAIIFGPFITAVIGTIVLLFQALLLAHGGLTTLGANSFSMAIAGPIISYLIYKGIKKLKGNTLVAVFFAAFLGDLFTYCVTSLQLGVAYPVGGFFAASGKFLGIFAVTQLPIAIAEGILTVLIFDFLMKYNKGTLTKLNVLSKEVR